MTLKTGSLQVGQRLPDVSLTRMRSDGTPETVSVRALFSGKKSVLFAVPGAFTPACHLKHVPGFVSLSSKMKEKGVDLIACVAVNDIFVLDAWAKTSNASSEIVFLADGNATFTRALGLELDASGFGMGVRSQRYAMILEGDVISVLKTEENAGTVDLSSAESLLASL